MSTGVIYMDREVGGVSTRVGDVYWGDLHRQGGWRSEYQGGRCYWGDLHGQEGWRSENQGRRCFWGVYTDREAGGMSTRVGNVSGGCTQTGRQEG